MKLSAPVYHLKRRARALSREQGIPLNKALDRIARSEGFSTWGLLAARTSATTPSSELLAQLSPGNLVLLAARPGQGKTQLGIRLIVEAVQLGRRAVLFTLEYNEREFAAHFEANGGDPASCNGLFEFDNSDAINSDHIMNRLAAAPWGSSHCDRLSAAARPETQQSGPDGPDSLALKAFAGARGLIMVFIAQVDRSYDAIGQTVPRALRCAVTKSPGPDTVRHIVLPERWPRADRYREGKHRVVTLWISAAITCKMATGTMPTLAKETQMQLNRLDHVNVKTANLDQMIKWYEDVLGMKSGARPPFPFPGAWMYAGDHPVVHLVGVDSQPAGQDPTLEHFALSATGYASFLETLDNAGTLPTGSARVPGIGVTQVNVSDDVDGNHIHIDFQSQKP